jgi:hypothetical protein
MLFPLTAALMIGSPGPTALGIAATAIGGYLAHEGFVVLLGRRGPRARREHARPAWRSIGLFGGLGAAGIALTAAQLDAAAWQGLGLAAVLSGLAVLMAWLGRERTMNGEILAAIALSAWSVPTALAAGLPWRIAFTIWALWSAAFAVATCAVQVVIARTTRRTHPWALGGGLMLSIAGPPMAVLLAQAGAVPVGAAITLLPSSLGALTVIAAPVSARRLRDVGWSFIAVCVATLALMVGVLR